MKLPAIALAREGAAQAGAAAILGAGEFEVLAHDPKQRRVRLGLHAHGLAVDCKCDRRHGFPPWQTVHPTSGIFRLNRGMVVVCWIGRKARIGGAAPWRGFLRFAGIFWPTGDARSRTFYDPMVGQSNFAGNIAYDDLREWLAMAERLGEVRTVKGANCEEEIGLAAEAVLRAEHGPCVVFEDIPGCPIGFRLLLNMFAGTRRNMTLGFPDHLTKWELSDAYREAYLQEQRIVPHVVVDDGPVFENVMMGDDVDVTIFPAPKWHEKDGGRYIGTGTYSITRDPEENWLNAGAYRAQVHDKKTVGIVMAAGHH